MRKIIIIAFALAFSVNIKAQQDDATKHFMKISSVSTSMGFAGVFAPTTMNDYYGLKNTIEDPDILIDPSGFGSESFFSDLGGNTRMKFNLGLTPFSKKKNEYRHNRELRLGVGFNSGIRRSFNFYKTDYIAADTFVSSNGNRPIYADSAFGSYHIYNENFYEFNINIAYLFKTDPSRRLYLYAGLGAEYGISIRYFLRYENIETSEIVYYDEANPPSGNDYYYYGKYTGDNGYTVNSSSTKTNMLNAAHFVRTYIPLGINFRISNGNSFWKHMNVYSEINPGLEFQIVPSDQTYVNPYWGVALVGLSYKF
jgi:hypothetical protein